MFSQRHFFLICVAGFIDISSVKGYHLYHSHMLQQQQQQQQSYHKSSGAWKTRIIYFGSNKGLMNERRHKNYVFKMSQKDNEVVDAYIERDDERRKEIESSSMEVSKDHLKKKENNTIGEAIRRLASLSLLDYKWRSSLFKANEADRKVEESIARMMGENPGYVRPMDATEDKIGPLGQAEKKAVEWLSSVIEEEGKRAKRIAEGDGNLIRPMDSDSEHTGPLATLERQTVQFFKRIIDSETERAASGKLRPMQLDESKRGPLGEAERKVVSALDEITESEKLRMQQSKARGWEIVRPIDIPGPLGEMERTALEVMQAENRRLKDKELRGKIVRPKDATIEGPLGKAERKAVEKLDRVREEEQNRLQSIQRMLQDKRPMEVNRVSPLGILEALIVGILRAPQLLLSVFDRVMELLQSEKLDGAIRVQVKESTTTNEETFKKRNYDEMK